MRISSPLRAQHLGWMFKKHWQMQSRRVPNDTAVAEDLEKFGIQVKDVAGVIKPETKKIEFDFEDNRQELVNVDTLYSHWNQRKCHTYGNFSVLLEGVRQAQVLTKTIEIRRFPKIIIDTINDKPLDSNVDQHIHRIIMSHALDSEQIQRPKLKLLDRPAINLPRDYSVTHSRRNRMLANELLSVCEKFSGKPVRSPRRVVDDANFIVTVAKFDDVLQFEVSADKFITSGRPIVPMETIPDENLPHQHPMKYTISMPKKNIYTMETFYPFRRTMNCSHPHTIISFFNKEFVGNLHGVDVSDSQYHSRTLLKAFTVAAARAKQLYGPTAIGDLPNPVVVQSIQTNGQTYHFGIFQLNTMSLCNSGALKNYWFHEANVDLFAECGFKNGRPYLKGYNKDVFRCLNAFYHNA